MKKKNFTYKQGSTDPDGETIQGIHANFPEFIIYKTERIGVKWYVRPDALGKKFANIDLKIHKLRSLSRNFYHDNIIGNTHIRALVLSATGNQRGADSVIKDAERRITRIRTVEWKLQYLLTCMIVVLINILLVLVTLLFEQSEIRFILFITTCGSLGAFLSVALNLDKLQMDLDAPKRIGMINGLSRMFIGMSAAVILYFLIQANILFGAIIKLNSDFAIFSACVAAGFSETLVPNLLKKMETEKDEA